MERPGWPVARRQCGREHLVAPVTQIRAGDDGDFMPAVPVNVAIAAENRIKTVLVEWHLGPGVMQELAELTALIRKNLVRGPILAYHKHIEDLLLESAHKENSRTIRCCLPPELKGISTPV